MLKFLSISLLSVAALVSCTQKTAVVQQTYVDSLVKNYTLPLTAKSIEGDALFWKQRISEQPENFVAKEKYAHALVAKFHLGSDIKDLKSADSILADLNNQAFSSTSGVKLTLANVKMLQHQFRPASELITAVQESGEMRNAVNMMRFDAEFELGNYTDAKMALAANKRKSEFAYQFRFAKQEDHEGSSDGAINHMKAAAASTVSPYLQTVALSNAADFYMHSGKYKEAYKLYKYCINTNPADFHSIEMIGWLALVHDHDVNLAVSIFNFLKTKTLSPHMLLQLSRSYELSDSKKATRYAEQFVQEVTDPVYSDMYNKYLVEVYTGILNNPSKALSIANKETSNRPTAQTFTWLASSLLANGQKNAAYNIFKEKVAGHSLEGQESFSICKLLLSLSKNNEAREYLEAAQKNIYELTPAMARELDSLSSAFK
jgi:tetratricopeptide (TPR) repeat protein